MVTLLKIFPTICLGPIAARESEKESGEREMLWAGPLKRGTVFQLLAAKGSKPAGGGGGTTACGEAIADRRPVHFQNAIPRYIGAFILICVRYDHHEKPGYTACLISERNVYGRKEKTVYFEIVVESLFYVLVSLGEAIADRRSVRERRCICHVVVLVAGTRFALIGLILFSNVHFQNAIPRPRTDEGCVFFRRRFIKKGLRNLFFLQTWFNLFLNLFSFPKPLLGFHTTLTIDRPSSPGLHYRASPPPAAHHQPHHPSPSSSFISWSAPRSSSSTALDRPASPGTPPPAACSPRTPPPAAYSTRAPPAPSHLPPIGDGDSRGSTRFHRWVGFED
ncbi:hypothetical protein R6Q57_027708 [Mikania cordata]